ncbi:MAG TPA: hypothetical protein PKO06_11440 [Candidatus Ozemobacteraceae bacterium]|nr:hypothetical protein [Candidatus Ozemobacteraceae bacterium]
MKTYQAGIAVLILLLMLYFLCPVTFFIALKHLYGMPFPNDLERKLDVVFGPVQFLADHIPWYGSFLRWQADTFLL